MVYNTPHEANASSTSKSHEGNTHALRPKVRIPHLLAAKGQRKLSALTCYDATFARLIEASPIDIVLVGDSLGHVIQGKNSTIGVSAADVAYHVRAVAQNLKTPLLVADMPFGCAGLSDDKCFDAAITLMQAGAESIKIEGASPAVIRQIEKLVQVGIPVMGHLGLTPQSVHALGGYKVQGKTSDHIKTLVKNALELEQAGCFAVVLELCTDDAGTQVSKSLKIPTIGIGSGPQCDGQILVLQDMLGMNTDFKPKFLKHFEQLEMRVAVALQTYDTEVKGGMFPPADQK